MPQCFADESCIFGSIQNKHRQQPTDTAEASDNLHNKTTSTTTRQPTRTPTRDPSNHREPANHPAPGSLECFPWLTRGTGALCGGFAVGIVEKRIRPKPFTAQPTTKQKQPRTKKPAGADNQNAAKKHHLATLHSPFGVCRVRGGPTYWASLRSAAFRHRSRWAGNISGWGLGTLFPFAEQSV